MRPLAAPIPLLALALAPRVAHAVRPFVTDDARVAEPTQVQLETWVRADREAVEHWAQLSLGLFGPLELTVGGVHGYADGRWAGAGPLVQAKILFLPVDEGRRPGLGVGLGVFPPLGSEAFRPPGWEGFAYGVLTHAPWPDDRFLVHLNVGGHRTSDGETALLWGGGVQVRVVGDLHGVAEVFSGDPYAASAGAAFQVGLRFLASEAVQVDGTFGRGLWGDPALPVWGTLGLRLVTDRLLGGP